MFGLVPGTRPNIRESQSEISTRVPFCIEIVVARVPGPGRPFPHATERLVSRVLRVCAVQAEAADGESPAEKTPYVQGAAYKAELEAILPVEQNPRPALCGACS